MASRVLPTPANDDDCVQTPCETFAPSQALVDRYHEQILASSVELTWLEEIRFATGLLTVLFVIGNLLDHFGITGGEPRHTNIAIGCVLSALAYGGCLLIDRLQDGRR